MVFQTNIGKFTSFTVVIIKKNNKIFKDAIQLELHILSDLVYHLFLKVHT